MPLINIIIAVQLMKCDCRQDAFKENKIGFVLYGDGTVGEEAMFFRQGLDLRWDWGNYYRDDTNRFKYAFVIEPDRTGLSYDFSTSMKSQRQEACIRSKNLIKSQRKYVHAFAFANIRSRNNLAATDCMRHSMLCCAEIRLFS